MSIIILSINNKVKNLFLEEQKTVFYPQFWVFTTLLISHHKISQERGISYRVYCIVFIVT